MTEPTSCNTEEAALQFLRSPDLAQLILADMEALGCVAEDRARLLTYLIAISRKLPRPLSGLLPPGPSQPILTDVMEQLTPEENVLRYTRMSAQELACMTELKFNNQLIIVDQHADPDVAKAFLRALQTLHSPRQRSQVLRVKDSRSGAVAPQFVTTEGPVAYLTADQRMSCSFVIPLDDWPDQAQRVLESQRARRLFPPHDLAKRCLAIGVKHRRAQRQLQAVPVCIPYAGRLSFPSRGPRVCQLQESFLGLIEASAVLHQHQRKWGATEYGKAYILADLQDYRLAYDLASELLADSLHELSRGARKLLARIREGMVDSACFYRKELHDLTGLDTPTLKDYLQELVELEYIGGGFEAKAYRIRYRLLGDREEAAPAPLVSPEELERQLTCLV